MNETFTVAAKSVHLPCKEGRGHRHAGPMPIPSARITHTVRTCDTRKTSRLLGAANTYSPQLEQAPSARETFFEAGLPAPVLSAQRDDDASCSRPHATRC